MKIKASAFGDCIAKIAELGEMSAKDAEALLNRVAKQGDKRRATDGFAGAAEDLINEATEKAKLAKLNALRDLEKRVALNALVDKNGGIKNAARTLGGAVYREIARISPEVQEDRDSAELRIVTMHRDWFAAHDVGMTKAGAVQAARSTAFDKERLEGLWREDGNAPNNDITISPMAQKMLDVEIPLLRKAVDTLNAEGANITSLTDFVTHLENEPRYMRRAAGWFKPKDEAFAAWHELTRPRQSEDSFSDLVPNEGESEEQARVRFMRSIYNAYVDGTHLTFDRSTGLETDDKGLVPRFGSRNIPNSLSKPALLKFKDSSALYDHLQQFGSSSNLTSAILHTLERSARNAGLMQKFGSRPLDNLNAVIDSVASRYQDSDLADKFRAQSVFLQNAMKRLDGTTDQVVYQFGARLGRGLRSFETSVHLGGVGVTHLVSNWPATVSELRQHGVPALGRYAAIAKGLFNAVQGKGPIATQELRAQLMAYSSGDAREYFANFNPTSDLPGAASYIAGQVLKYSGINRIFDGQKAAVSEVLGNQLARNAGKEFEELDPYTQQMLGFYRIGKDEWDLYRSVEPTENAGMRYMVPDAALNITDEQATKYLVDHDQSSTPMDIKDFKNDLSLRLAELYVDAQDHSVVTPGVREQTMMLGDSRPGTWSGEMRRFLSQYSFWPLAAYNQILKREIYNSLSKKDMAVNIFTIAALSAAAGYVRGQVNNIVAGRPIENPLNPRTLLNGLALGGGLGIVGDYLFGQVYQSYGASSLLDRLGPVTGDIDQLYQLYNKFQADVTMPTPHPRGRFSDLWPELARFGAQHIPFANLLYLKGAFDYLLFYHLFEAASPGWWERSNRAIAKRGGQTMQGYTPGGGIPFGVPGLYLKGAGKPTGILAGLGGG